MTKIADFVNYFEACLTRDGVNRASVYGCQKRMIAAIFRERKTMLTGPRQVGMTTTVVAWAAWSAEKLGQRVLYASSCTPAAHAVCRNAATFTAGEMVSSKTQLRFPSGGHVDFVTANSQSIGRGLSYDSVIIDNAQYVRGLPFVIKSVSPCLKNTGKLVLASTGRRDMGDFGRMCEDAELGENEMFHMRITRRDAWEGDMAGLREENERLKKILGEQAFRLEYGASPSMPSEELK